MGKRLEKITSFCCSDYDSVKVTEMGNITEVLYMAFRNDIPRIKKIDKDHYVVVGPDGSILGEVREFCHITNRAESARSLYNTFRRLRNLINANVVDVDKVRFVTLTYAQVDGQPMRDVQRLYRDFDLMRKRLARWCKKNGVDTPQYINVVEPQASGAWHCHVLYIWPGKAPYLPNESVAKMWGQGFVAVRALRDKLGRACDNVGAYLTAYLGDLAIDEALDAGVDITQYPVKMVEDDGGECRKNRKYFLKGARLAYYPPGMNIYRCSRGVMRPVESMETWKSAKEKVSAATLTFASHLRLSGLTDGRVNVISKRYYNTAVQGRQAISEGIRYDVDTGEVLDDERSYRGVDTAALVNPDQRWVNQRIRDLTSDEIDALPWSVDCDTLSSGRIPDEGEGAAPK